ncbi:Efflux pump membrane transporter BepE [Enhygromyxa salina]|uniref:Efflux pump membrane transporter BepE n=1 Tax=Enhygromyxa salina TaxID=215803 RepID=A0A2S9XYZ7_9BACT|nr:multidrug efflux RND transporter permease subunit [Enhygromyxa salina]PRP98074.1 Efflux pump membrane transporter BepE [Enhygromyxa salina]
MNVVNFFIGRPIFAAVVAIVTTLIGLIALVALPVAQFPQITPPAVSISATYAGASAEVVEQSVAIPLEQQINGVEGMRYMSSTSSSDGSLTINITFEQGYDQDIAAVDVQNRISLAQPRLPEEVIRQGITVRKQSSDLTMIVAIASEDGSRDEVFLHNYAVINVIDALNRIEGVSEARIFSPRDYSMRAWLDIDKLAQHQLTPADVIAAIREQNVQAAVGRVGAPPTSDTMTFDYAIVAEGRLDDETEFGDIVVAHGQDDALVRLRDVARVELGAESYTGFKRVDGMPVATIGIFQLPEANALEVADKVRAEVDRLSATFPPGVSASCPIDPTRFVRASIFEVVLTVIVAVVLVVLVTFVFLGTWQTTLVPVVTIPVALIGALAIIWALGFSINTLTLFGLVLAIGIVVDDAIVVVENVDRLTHENHIVGRPAARRAMKDVTAPVIATSVVLMVVFIPAAFIPGLSGQLYRQFSLTIIAAVLLSTINALTLSPALSAVLLRRPQPVRGLLLRFSTWLQRRKLGYERLLRVALRRRGLVVASFVALLFGTWAAATYVPRGFIPTEDQGYFIVSGRMPSAASIDRTNEVAKLAEAKLAGIEGVEHYVSIGGFDIRSGRRSATDSFTIFVSLDEWDERIEAGRGIDTIVAEATAELGELSDAELTVLRPPPIRGLGTTGGFEFKVLDRSGGDYGQLFALTGELLAEIAARPEVAGARTSSVALVPQIRVEIDRTRAAAFDVAIDDVLETLQYSFGAFYVNDFNRFGRVYRVMVQGEDEYRVDQEDIRELYVKNAHGELVRLDNFVVVHRDHGPDAIEHFNLFRSTTINGAAATSSSSSDALTTVEQAMRDTMPDNIDGAWSGLAYEEREASGYTGYIFGLGIVVTFLVLAALYESWSLPLVIMLGVPPAILGALGLMYLRGINNDIYCQIGLLLLIGLASKNAILIVEFARELVIQGRSLVDAAIEASTLRLRPILMTAISFVAGVLPLAFATGAGAAARQSLGTAVLGGMVLTTILSLFLVPVLFVIIGSFTNFQTADD